MRVISIPKAKTRIRILLGFFALMIAALAVLAYQRRDGCAQYVPIDGYRLVVHGGGGLPDRTYANSFEAMDLAVANGFRLIEIDFWLANGGILLSHERPKGQELTSLELLQWLRRHPDVSIVTDFKTGNVRGLTILAQQAGPLRAQLIPQIYNPSEYEPVKRLGMQTPVLTLYRVSEPWREFANSAELQFVTIPEPNRALAREIQKPVFLHTVNRAAPYPVAGFYTDCLIPAR